MEKVLAELTGSPKALKHVDVAHDASAPVIEPGVGLGTWDKDGLLKGIQQGIPLKHVETDDKSAPKIEPDTHIGANPHKKLMEEVTKIAQAKSGGGAE